MHNIIDITIDFEFGVLRNRAMKTLVIHDESTFEATPDSKTVKIPQVKLPTRLQIVFSGKTNRDTIVDENGNIIGDMYVKVVGLRLDNLKVPTWVIEKKLSYITTNGDTINTSYIGFNGTMTLDIPETNIFYLFRRLNKDD